MKYAIIASRRDNPRFYVAKIDRDIGHVGPVGRRGTQLAQPFMSSYRGGKIAGEWVWDEHTGVDYPSTIFARGDDPDELQERIERARLEWDARTKIIDELNAQVRAEVAERVQTESAILNTPTKE